ncbi:MAG: hypothetical protein HRU10_14685 [Opitutales bacterium]|nr:hypothetical protein [Opitutales bacterium]
MSESSSELTWVEFVGDGDGLAVDLQADIRPDGLSFNFVFKDLEASSGTVFTLIDRDGDIQLELSVVGAGPSSVFELRIDDQWVPFEESARVLPKGLTAVSLAIAYPSTLETGNVVLRALSDLQTVDYRSVGAHYPADIAHSFLLGGVFEGGVAEVAVIGSSVPPDQQVAYERGLAAKYGIDIDLDSDGISDAWEMQNGLNPMDASDAGGDVDGDGLTALDEFFVRSNPNSPDTDGDRLDDFFEVSAGLDPTNLDSDGDLLSDWWESEHGFDPLSNDLLLDADSDGMADAWEQYHGLDLSIDDSQEDMDGDGLSNYAEFLANTHPRSIDTDADSLPDDWELAYSLDPLDDGTFDGAHAGGGDPDGDGLLNIQELEFATSPLLVDTDADGVWDGDQQTGLIRWEYWDGPTSLAKLYTHAAYPGSPEVVRYKTSFEGPVDFDDTYATRMRGFISPLQDGFYTFWIVGDNASVLLLSSDDSPLRKRRIAWVPTGQWAHIDEWDKFPTQRSEPVWLESGSKYYIETVHAEGGGQDNIAVAWHADASLLEIVGADVLSPYFVAGSDTDRDGLPDDWEALVGLDIHDPGIDVPLNGPRGDPDDDGLVNEYEFLNGTDPFSADSDGDGASDTLELSLEMLSADQSTSTDSDLGSEPWLQANIDLQAGDLFNLAGANILMATKVDAYFDAPFFYQAVEGDFEISAKLSFPEIGYALPAAGFMVRDSLEKDASTAYYSVSRTDRYDLRSKLNGSNRLRRDADAHSLNQQRYKWLKMTRRGDTIAVYQSADGYLWTQAGESSLATTETLLVGSFIVSNGTLGLVEFSSLSLVQDTDGDGLTDDEEAVLGTSDTLADTDGDGFDDGEEIHFYLSNPSAADLGQVTEIEQLDLSSTVSTRGRWRGTANSIESITPRGEFRMPLNIPADGIYVLEFEAYPLTDEPNISEYEIAVSIDEQFVERLFFDLPARQSVDRVRLVLPWLAAGNHQIGVAFENFKLRRGIGFSEISLSHVDGPDSDSNARPDWVDHRLEIINAIEVVSAQSHVSPFCLEGRSRFELFGDVDGQPLEQIPGERWFSNIQLAIDAPTSARVSLENGAVETEVQIEWVPIDLSTTPEVSQFVRVGDTLLFTVEDPSSNPASAASILLDGQALAGVAVGSRVPIVFDTEGVYSVQGRLNGVDLAPITVTVIGARFAESPVAVVAQGRNWENPQIPDSVEIETDWRMSVSQIPLTQGRVFEITTSQIEPLFLAARLPGGGPVIDSQSVRGLRVASTNAASIELLEVYEDGSQLFEMSLVQSNNYPEVHYTKDIFVAGVLFDDGSVFKVVEQEEFNDLGIYYVRYIRPATVKTSICHQTLILDGPAVIGKPRG